MNHAPPTELSTKGDLFVYELTNPNDHTLNGQVRVFRDESRESADTRARKLAARERCGLRRKAVI